jgi:hypothetical protein
MIYGCAHVVMVGEMVMVVLIFPILGYRCVLMVLSMNTRNDNKQLHKQLWPLTIHKNFTRQTEFIDQLLKPEENGKTRCKTDYEEATGQISNGVDGFPYGIT